MAFAFDAITLGASDLKSTLISKGVNLIYTSSMISSPGLFTTDNPDINSITNLSFGGNDMLGTANFVAIETVGVGGFIYLNGVNGSALFQVTSINPGDDTIGVSVLSSNSHILGSTGEEIYSFTFFQNAAPPTLTTVLNNSSITPAADNTYATPTSITIQNGIITAIS